ncbi:MULTISPECIES: succinate dehydrogenase, hydrophobic membrane anchor protein [unclassified Chelatococcus]|uniref:succinate dehydrogenase, hydrophobic membrane anchor protein n=1 Tax=unclassified Chelatococcus TaxID=2638111 RepID=UPI001BCB0CB7|nr:MULTISPECIES: succinate dehydrogenase, hydrophobic membrane anchor protein [unclassified Chelatococcus]MBS7697236.1 succinate dehydrogenase, hydrophobic membrane anchor protein [Chelatococcus sp. YT9]MBX3556467.1 succinate dehydrogenase, hydrophobic membrane anchor protein [Chelatococcus sp.]
MSQFKFSIRTPAGRVRGLGSAKSGTEHFWLQRLTAVANVPLAIAFIIIVVSVAGRDFEAARLAISQPLIAILLLLFILSGVIHMRIGMQVIIEDYVHSEGAKVVAVIANTFFAVVIGAAATFAVLKIAFGI